MHITHRIVRQIEAATAEHNRLVAAACRHTAARIDLWQAPIDPIHAEIAEATHLAQALADTLYRIISITENNQ